MCLPGVMSVSLSSVPGLVVRGCVVGDVEIVTLIGDIEVVVLCVVDCPVFARQMNVPP